MSDRLDDYFVAEATGALDQLERLLSVADIPDPQQLLNLATSVRGSALRAGAITVGSVAERLEDAARSLVTKNVSWSEDFRSLSQQTVADLKLLVRALNRWGPLEEARVREAILRWNELEGVSGGASPEDPGSSTPAGSSARFAAGTRPADRGTMARGRPAPVPIDTVLLRGHRALDAALELRPEIDRLTHEIGPLAPLIEELFDLIELGLTTDPEA